MTIENPQRVEKAISTVKSRYWSNYGYSRIYISVNKAFALAGVRKPHDLDEGTKFYLDVDECRWNLTGDNEVDAQLIDFLNSLANEPALTRAYDATDEAVMRYDYSSLTQADIEDFVTEDRTNHTAQDRELLKAILSDTAVTSQFPRAVWVSVLRHEKFTSSSSSATVDRATHSDDPELLNVIAREGKTVGLRELVGENPATSFETLMFIYEQGVYPQRLINHPDVPEAVIANMLFSFEGRKLIRLAEEIAVFTPGILDAVCRARSNARLVLVSRNHPCLTADLLDRFAYNANTELVKAIVRHPEVGESTLRRLLNDPRVSLLPFIITALRERGRSPWDIA